MRIPLMFVSFERSARVMDRWRGITGKVSDLFPKLRINLTKTDIGVEADQYVGACVLSAFIWSLFAFLVLFLVLHILGADINRALLLTFLSGFVIFLLFLSVLLFYPSIIAGKKAELIDKDLVYALKDMLLEVSAGASLYDALTGIARTDYGIVSEEFGNVVKKVDAGTPVDDALEELALRTTSEYLRNAIWQIVNALRAGSDIHSALEEIVRDLTSNRRTKIRSYAQELNILSLLYMLFAVVIPTIAITMIIIVGPFLGLSAGPEIFYYVLPITFFIQIALLKLIKSRRPVVHL